MRSVLYIFFMIKGSCFSTKINFVPAILNNNYYYDKSLFLNANFIVSYKINIAHF